MKSVTGHPNLVHFQVEHGTYVVPKVLERGYLAIGTQKWTFERVRAVDAMDAHTSQTRRRRAACRITAIHPAGVLPRRVQTWVMAGLALLIVIVIVLTGNREPPRPSMSFATPPGQPAPVRQNGFGPSSGSWTNARRAWTCRRNRPTTSARRGRATARGVRSRDPLVDERRRREDQSLSRRTSRFTTRAGAFSGRGPDRPVHRPRHSRGHHPRPGRATGPRA